MGNHPTSPSQAKPSPCGGVFSPPTQTVNREVVFPVGFPSKPTSKEVPSLNKKTIPAVFWLLLSQAGDDGGSTLRVAARHRLAQD